MFGARKFLSGSILNLDEVRYLDGVRYPDEDNQEAVGVWVRYSVKKSTPFIFL